MRKYELIVIVDAAMPQEEKEQTIKTVDEVIGKCEGTVVNSQVWLEKHRFSFHMKKRSEGTYFLVNFECPAGKISDLRQALKLNDKVLRSLVVKVD